MIRGRVRTSAASRPVTSLPPGQLASKRASEQASKRKKTHSPDALYLSHERIGLIDRHETNITPHLQLNQFMFLLFQSVRRSKHFFGCAKARNSFLSSNGESYAKIGLPIVLSSQYLPHKFQLGAVWSLHSRTMPITFFKRKPRVLPNRYNSRFSKLTIDSMDHLALIAWRRLSSICSYGGPAFQQISARAITLAFLRSHLAHSIFALAVGRGTWAHKTWADAGRLQNGSTVYTRPHDHHIYITSFLFSVFEGVILLLRAVYLAILFTPAITMAPFSDCFGPQFRKAWLYVLHLTLEMAGPAFIKWGQWAATRSDLFPRDLCTELARLQTEAPAHKFYYTKKAIESAFGQKISEIFEDFEEVPVASGSIAQVHQATLRIRYPGRHSKPIKVAVKVRHPGVGESIRRDFVIIDLVAKISYIIPTLKWLRLDESVQQFAVSMLSQIDLAKEAAYLSHFLYNFRRWKDVSFPKPLYPFVHPAVLVETYEHGKSVSHFVDELEGDARIKTALAHIGTHALLKMLLVDNFIHADMHPGNILVRVSQPKHGKKLLFNPRPHVIFLDVGMTAELSKNDHQNLLEFFKAVALRDGRTAAECTLRLSKKQNCPDPKAFIEEVTRSFDFWGTPEGDIIHPAECMQQLLEQVRRHRVNIDGNVCMVMVTVLVLEGWQRKLDPEYNVMHTLQTLLLKADWAKSLSYTIEGLMAP